MRPVKKAEASKEAKHLAALLLDVLAGVRTPPQAAESLGCSLARYYQLEDRAMNGFLSACEPVSRGRRSNGEAQLQLLMKENERLQRELARQQSLVRLTQRSVGVPLPSPARETDRKKRKRKPMVRAMRRAGRLRAEAQEEAKTEATAGVA